MTTCTCGCGQIPATGKQFCHGHNRRGTTRSPATLAKVRATWADRHDQWSAGIRAGTTTPEARAAYSRAKKGKALSPEHRAKIGAANAGKPKSEEHRQHLAEAGRINDVTWSHGRAWAYRSDHPVANKRGRVHRATLVLERTIGRFLRPSEVVHHINLDMTDDHQDNLMVMTRPGHTAFHHRLRRLGTEDHFRDWFSKTAREMAWKRQDPIPK